jgi:glycosyltransferase involved in cell wall biosynthesis
MKNVAIVQHRLLHYRVELFELMKNKLADKDICLHLIHGEASTYDSKRKDEGVLDWSNKIKNRFQKIFGVELIWQPLPKITKECDLLILMQENKIISNYSQIIIRHLKGKKTGYWGHGKNLQSEKPNGIKEVWKRKWLNSTFWWFAYTVSTVEYLIEKSFPSSNITLLNNAIDVNGFKSELCDVLDVDIINRKKLLHIPLDASIGLFCGSIYKEKRLDLLLNSADLIKENNASFFLIIVGDGPDAEYLHEAAKSRPWLLMVGVQIGKEKALYYKMASVILNPGAVGLHILDSFCAGKPFVTTNDALHGPEFDYIKHDLNGVVTNSNNQDYADAVIKLLDDDSYYNSMRTYALHESNKYTVEAMADNFCTGIIKCLATEINK